MSNWFTIGQGVHKGAPMSMLLFQIFFNPLIKELRNLKKGAKILNIDVPFTAFADDLDMITLFIPAMQIIVNKAAYFGHRRQLEFNVPKCSVLECNNTVRLKNQLITKLNSTNNLGTLLKLPKERDIEFTEGRISSARRCISGFLAIGSNHAPVNPISAARVYNSVSLSRMLYGIEVSDVSNSSFLSLEDVHWDIGKRIQGLN